MTDWEKFEAAVRQSLDSVCFAADRLAVGVSGGADSMCLLAVLAQLRGKENIVAVHVQHGIRGAEAIADACKRAAAAIECYISEGPDRAMTKYNRKA